MARTAGIAPTATAANILLILLGQAAGQGVVFQESTCSTIGQFPLIPLLGSRIDQLEIQRYLIMTTTESPKVSMCF